ncbi:MAG TPA: aminotransferase class I/II-fold pyridoxal phosphate-dependent enzyme [Candidatus Microbacterium stercoravium]|uniref:Aminotransferase class I/II-fold pyridoxal phosphate-dependent enzyme n=1 Tax=Candidatus Microbacterium stercoravium TaxID=2838697 RepID=A0A9D2KHA3_9MICO|nr:aminotransferase class I/II-fold pyridoxal phosphate-dependent enzyme [Candidatus Microbacterium stercoravium]
MTPSAPAGTRIVGTTAAEISDSVRRLVDRGVLAPGDALPPVRALAEQLGINRNTAVAAYRQLATSGVVVSAGRSGTRIVSPDPVAQEGFSRDDGARDVGAGNPDPRFIPDPSRALAQVTGRPVLYGSPVVDPDLETWARAFLSADLERDADALRVTVTSGASDALDRLFTALLTPGDVVAIEDPGFLTGIHTLRVGGYRAAPVPLDDEGMTPEGLRAALAAGARAVVHTPRAQNPTGVSLTAARARELRAILADHPYVLLVEDDHFSLLSRRGFHSLIGPGHERWALVRSVSKFLGPDMSVALVASDAHTADRLGMRLRPGTAWVSHLLQRLALALVTDDAVRADIERAGSHYAARNDAFRTALARHGIDCPPSDGLSIWVPVSAPARSVTARLRERGWVVRSGDEFRVSASADPSHRVRVTAHDLDDAAQDALAAAIAAAA